MDEDEVINDFFVAGLVPQLSPPFLQSSKASINDWWLSSSSNVPLFVVISFVTRCFAGGEEDVDADDVEDIFVVEAEETFDGGDEEEESLGVVEEEALLAGCLGGFV